MNNIIYNIGYFFKEAKTIIKINMMTNIFSILSIGLIFFILIMVLSSWWISGYVVDTIQSEAEINVFFGDSVEDDGILQMVESIKKINGVMDARLIDEDEAYNRMSAILGEEAKVLKYLDDNPFSPFIEVKIQLGEMEKVLEGLKSVPDIEQIRDNRDVLERLRGIIRVFEALGWLIMATVSITTVITISHIIKSGIYNNREQINTLRLLGASESFIAFPFLIEGLILTMAGAMAAFALAVLALKAFYSQMAGPLPFIPLPPREALESSLFILGIVISLVLGIVGGIFGLLSAKVE